MFVCVHRAPSDPMKKCDYCARDNDEQATHCHECGTALTTDPSPHQPLNPVVRPDPPRALRMVLWSTLAIESPFLIGFLLAHGLSCSHCRKFWLIGWPVLPGLVPAFFAMTSWKNLLPRGANLPEWTFFVLSGLVTVGLIALLFMASFRSRRWRWILAAGFLVSSVLALLCHAILAA